MALEDAFTPEDETTVVLLPDGAGGHTEHTVYVPTTEQLVLFSASVSDPAHAAAGVIDIIEDIFDEDDFRELRRRLRLRRSDPARLRVEDLSELLEKVMESVSGGFPTQPASDSSRSATPTGGRSTGRVRSAALTPVASRSGGS